MQKQWTVIFLWSQRRTPGDAIGIERYNRAIPVRSSLPPLVVRFRTAITDSALKEFLEAHDGSLRGAPSKSASPGCGGVLILAFWFGPLSRFRLAHPGQSELYLASHIPTAPRLRTFLLCRDTDIWTLQQHYFREIYMGSFPPHRGRPVVPAPHQGCRPSPDCSPAIEEWTIGLSRTAGKP